MCVNQVRDARAGGGCNAVVRVPGSGGGQSQGGGWAGEARQHRGRGVATHNISPRPFARAKESCAPTLITQLDTSAPARIANCFASRLQKDLADGPKPPVTSTAKGRNPHPTAWQACLPKAIFRISASSAADARPPLTADEAEKRSGWEMVTSIASGLGSQPRSKTSAGRRREPGKATSTSGRQLAASVSAKRRSRTWL